MGQRHQVYVRLPAINYGKGTPNTKPERTIGLHHQWLYGFTAIRLLRNYLMFWERCDKQYNQMIDLGGSVQVLEGCYSIDAERAYNAGVSMLVSGVDASLEDPRKGDNNNGITVIDLRGKKPKYAFLSIDHLETGPNQSVRHPEDPDHGQTEFYTNFSPINAEHWMSLHYDKVSRKADPEDTEKNSWIKFVMSHDLLTVAELAEIFPNMVSEVDGKGLYLMPNSLKFMEVDMKPLATKSTTITKKKVSKKKPDVKTLLRA